MVHSGSLDPEMNVEFLQPVAVRLDQLPAPYNRELPEGTQFYSECICGDQLLQVNTCVRLNTRAKAAPRSVIQATAAHARILYLYTDERRVELPHRAIVEYFVRPNEVAAIVSRQANNISIDNAHELILDHRKSPVADVPVVAAFDAFVVHFAAANESLPPMAATASGDAVAVGVDKYVCRYKIIKMNGKYCLFPWAVTAAGVAIHDNKENTPHKLLLADNVLRSPGKRKAGSGATTQSVTPIKIVNNSVQKVQHASTRPQSNQARSSAPALATSESSDSEVDVDGELSPRKRRKDHTISVNNNYIKSSACKNLNESLGGGAGGGNDDLNYSIEQQDTLKVKIRISDRSKRDAQLQRAGAAVDTVDTPSRRTRRQTVHSAVPTPNTAATTQPEPNSRLAQSRQEPAPAPATPTTSTSLRKSVRRTPSMKQAAVDSVLHSSAIDAVREKLLRPARRSIRLSSVCTTTTDDDDRDRDFVPNGTARTPSKRKTIAASRATPATPKSTAKATKTNGASAATPAKLLRSIRDGTIAPGLQKRTQRLNSAQPAMRSDIQLVKESLHVSAVPQSLPCRETEFHNIESFIERKILDRCGGCMYVSGVPGTGKTATVTEVIRTLRARVRARELPDFEYVAINGMKMTEPRQAYVEINRQLSGEKLSCEQAQKALETRFTRQSKSATAQKTTVLLVDELDILCNRRQDVVYNILDWPTKMAARLVVVTIANTMDLPERLLMGKVTSRLGLTRLTFQPYSHKQLQEVVQARLAGTKMFQGDAVQFVARKVASVSGDCRRALDICRRSIEIAEAAGLAANEAVVVSMEHVHKALTEMISSTKVQAIKACSRMEQMFLQGVEAEVTRTGVEETTFQGVYAQFEAILRLMGMAVPAPGRAMLLSSRLGASKLIIAESARNDINQKILLNVSADDIHYALHAKM